MIQQSSFFILVLACFLEQGSSFSGLQLTPSTLSLLEASALKKLNNQVTLTSYKDNTTMTSPWLSTFIEERNQIQSLPPSFTNKIKNDPARIEIVSLQHEQQQLGNNFGLSPPPLEALPLELLMQGSAPYIAQNLEKTVVFHIPSDLIDNKNGKAYTFKNMLSDIAMTWVLGMKIVLVLGSSSEQLQGDEQQQDAAAVLRTEVERQLNHYLYIARGGPCIERQVEGNVIGGHFYTAKRVGIVADDHIHHTGYASHVDADRIHRMLQDNNDIVLLTSHGQGNMGQAISVDGHQLTASVATAVKAHKVIYMSKEGSVLSQTQLSSCDSSSGSSSEDIQTLPMSLAMSITEYHNVRIRGQGKAAAVDCEGPAHAIELLNNLVWASWAVDNGVTSAHIVNPTDGAILEELFTSKHGSNICIYNDEDDKSIVNGEDEDDVEEIVCEENAVDDTFTTRMMSSTAFVSKRNRPTINREQGKFGAFIR